MRGLSGAVAPPFDDTQTSRGIDIAADDIIEATFQSTHDARVPDQSGSQTVDVAGASLQMADYQDCHCARHLHPERWLRAPNASVSRAKLPFTGRIRPLC